MFSRHRTIPGKVDRCGLKPAQVEVMVPILNSGIKPAKYVSIIAVADRLSNIKQLDNGGDRRWRTDIERVNMNTVLPAVVLALNS
jgi:hypothetical protein